MTPPTTSPAPAVGGHADGPDATYGRLRAATRNPRRAGSLDHLKRACDHLVQVKATDWSLANVARTVKALGLDGPGEQTVRNDKQYKVLYEAYRDAHATGAKPTHDDHDERLLLAIRDEGVMARVRGVLAENRKLKRALDMLHNDYATLRAIPAAALEAYARKEPLPAVVEAPPPPPVTAEEARVLRRFLANATEMLDCGWDEHGALLTSAGLEVAGYGFRRTLERLAATIQVGPDERPTAAPAASENRRDRPVRRASVALPAETAGESIQ